MNITELENQKAQLRDTVRFRDIARRLATSKDFQELILQKFCIDECARYVQLSVSPNLSAESRELSLRCAQSAGHLREFLNSVETLGNIAERDIKALDEMIDNALRGELTEE